jgi:hypothetical protein
MVEVMGVVWRCGVVWRVVEADFYFGLNKTLPNSYPSIPSIPSILSTLSKEINIPFFLKRKK